LELGHDPRLLQPTKKEKKNILALAITAL